MIAPTDFPPDPTRGRILLDGYRNVLIWEGSKQVLTEMDRINAEYRKSIASHYAPFYPKVNQKWLDTNTGKMMVHFGGDRWFFEENGQQSAIPVYPVNPPTTIWYPPLYPTGAELEKAGKPVPKPLPEEPEPPKKSRVFTFE